MTAPKLEHSGDGKAKRRGAVIAGIKISVWHTKLGVEAGGGAGSSLKLASGSQDHSSGNEQGRGGQNGSLLKGTAKILMSLQMLHYLVTVVIESCAN